MNLAHHYTTTLRLAFIVADQCLRPGSDGLLWFTQAGRAGALEPADPELAACEGVPVRLACPACLLMPWRRVARTVGWSTARIYAEEDRARAAGENPNTWLAATQSMSVSRTSIQILTQDRGWWPLEGRDLKANRSAMLTLPLTRVLRAGPIVRLYRRRKLAITACRMRYFDGEERFFRLENGIR